jgi:antitoxin component YwqK of YwqJK toxin-antitoxin module
MHFAVAIALRASLALILIAPAPWALAATASLVVTGNCRNGQPHGAYELRMGDGTLRVAGAFTRGKRTGTFLFWSSSGVRIALLPYDDDSLSGTVALWYSAGTTKAEPRRKLEAVYANGLHAGSARSWYPDGRPRTEFRYDNGVLDEARAWTAKGAPMTEAEARAMAARDLAEDERFYTTLEAIVGDNPPQCIANGRKP